MTARLTPASGSVKPVGEVPASWDDARPLRTYRREQDERHTRRTATRKNVTLVRVGGTMEP
jgi:hypothetical protein